jgi:hypothetical protein
MHLREALDNAQYHHMRKATINQKESEQENFTYVRLMFSTTCKYNTSKHNEPIKESKIH